MRIAPIFLYPKPGEAETEQKQTADVDEVLETIDRYLIAMPDFLEANAKKSILPPPAE